MSRVLGEFEVVEDGAGGGYAAGEMVDAETLERRGRELLAEFFTVDLLREDPFVEPGCNADPKAAEKRSS